MSAKSMKPAAFTAIRKSLGLSKSALADLLRLGPDGRKAVGMWEAGTNVRGIPGPAQVAMLAMKDGWRPRGVTLPCDEKESK